VPSRIARAIVGAFIALGFLAILFSTIPALPPFVKGFAEVYFRGVEGTSHLAPKEALDLVLLLIVGALLFLDAGLRYTAHWLQWLFTCVWQGWRAATKVAESGAPPLRWIWALMVAFLMSRLVNHYV
jgi:hypothetical protein